RVAVPCRPCSRAARETNIPRSACPHAAAARPGPDRRRRHGRSRHEQHVVVLDQPGQLAPVPQRARAQQVRLGGGARVGPDDPHHVGGPHNVPPVVVGAGAGLVVSAAGAGAVVVAAGLGGGVPVRGGGGCWSGDGGGPLGVGAGVVGVGAGCVGVG